MMNLSKSRNYLLVFRLKDIKKTVLEPMLNIVHRHTKEYHTDVTVNFVITMSEDNLQKSLNIGLHKIFKLQTILAATTIILLIMELNINL